MRKFLFSIRDLKNFIKPFCYISLAFVLAFGFITIVASGGGDGDENNQPPPIILGLWTWVSGDDTGSQAGVYGTKGVAAETTKPGSRNGSVSWIDSSDNLWLFGGWGYDANGNIFCYLNDLWKFDGTYWTWVSGDDTGDRAGVYGTKGVAAETNKPGSRSGSVSWIDSSDNLWLFGGCYEPIFKTFNDLWKFDGTYWTWVSGDDTGNQAGVYGTKGVAAEINKPGSRFESVSWIDSSGNLWLFGGNVLNDLWKFTPNSNN